MSLLLLFWLTACSPSPSPARTSTLTVLAASSLTDVFTALERDFESAHPTVDVLLSFAGSQTLKTQVRHGIDADVIATANADHLQELATEGLVAAPRAFASNRLALVLRESPPAPWSLADLGAVERIVLGAPEVPIGAYTATFLHNAQQQYGAPWREQVEAHVVSREPSVRLVLAKVALGEADAAVVYATDARSAPSLHTVVLPEQLAPSTINLHAALHDAAAQASPWLDFVEGEHGQAVLRRHGFSPAP